MSSPASEKTPLSPHAEEATNNKIKNEEFKIWKKAIPTFYEHISTFKPNFSKTISKQCKLQKTIAFSDKVFPDKSKGTLTTSVLFAQGNNVYEIDVILPIGICHNDVGYDTKMDPQYEAFLKVFEETKFEPKWTFKDDTIQKIYYLNQNGIKFVCLTSQGSVLWFKDEITTPVKTYIVDPVDSDTKLCIDLDISSDLSTIILARSLTKHDKSTTSISIVDNKDNLGEIKRVIDVSDDNNANVIVETCKFLKNNEVVGLCSTDSTVKFWDMEKDVNVPSSIFTDSNDGILTAFESSKIVDTLFVTGSETGIIKLWDLRSIFSREEFIVGANEPKPLAKLSHFEEDSIVDIIFSQTSACEFISVGKSGNVYHWDMEYLFSRYDDDNEDEDEIVDSSDLQTECLSFYHTGGCRRSLGEYSKKNTVAIDAAIDGITCTVDSDGLLTVYKPFTAIIKSETEDITADKSS